MCAQLPTGREPHCVCLSDAQHAADFADVIHIIVPTAVREEPAGRIPSSEDAQVPLLWDRVDRNELVAVRCRVQSIDRSHAPLLVQQRDAVESEDGRQPRVDRLRDMDAESTPICLDRGEKPVIAGRGREDCQVLPPRS